MSDSEDDSSYPPWNFTWVVNNQLAMMSQPRTAGNLRWVEDQGINHLVTLSPERRPPIHLAKNMEWTEIPIGEFEAPTMKQIKKFIEICQRCILKNQIVGVHCRQGLGRSGAMAACYLVQFEELAPERAIMNVRHKRTGAIETYEQEQAVIRYHDCIRGLKNV